jgi:hypothetical protein
MFCPVHNTEFFGISCPICNESRMTMDTTPRIPDFIESLDKMRALHLRKNADYAQDSNPYSNFDFTEYVLSHFKSDLDKSFVWPIATKLARLANLLDSKEPNNESIEDSFLDIAVYVLLWKARRSNMSAHQLQK